MKTDIKSQKSNQFKLTISIDQETLTNQKQKNLEILSAGLKISGFRKGKVPLDVAEKYLKPEELATSVINDIINSTITKAMIDLPQIPLSVESPSVTKFVPYTTLEYTVEVKTMPKIKLPDYKKLKAKRETAKITEKDITDVLKNIQKNHAKVEAVSRPAKSGDQVVVDFVGKKDKVAFKGGSASNQTISLGSGNFIPGFEEAIIGHSAGEKFDADLNFPADYHEKTLAGQKTVFSFHLKAVKELILPELTDDFVSKHTPLKTVADLKKDIKEHLALESEHSFENKYREDIIAELLENTKGVEPTESQIKIQFSNLKFDYEHRAKSFGLSLEKMLELEGSSLESWTKEAENIAKKRATSALILEQIARNEGLFATDAELSAQIGELRKVYKDSKEALKNLQAPAIEEDIRHRLTMDKTIEFLANIKK